LIVDARREPTANDLTMQHWLEARDLPYLVAATKWDKLSAGERARAQRSLREGFGGSGLAGEPLAVSARTGLGIRELWRYIDAAIEQGQD
jgi:GTP-binding protein